jgi:sulfate-transporting ATPase
MQDVFRFSLLGVGAGGLYALAALGLVLIYRGSSVVNFAQTAIGMAGAYAFYELRVTHGWNSGVGVAAALVLGLLVSAVLSGGFYLVFLRRMQDASRLSKIVATLAFLVTISSIAEWRYGETPLVVPSIPPTSRIEVLGASVGEDRLIILAVVLVVTTVLWLVYRFTTFGVATSAVSENPRAAAALAVSPNVIATINWSVGGLLGGAAAILIVPITGLGPANNTFLVIPVLAAAVIGGFSSFPIVAASGIVLGITQSLVTRYVDQSGWATAVPFIFVAVFLIARGSRVAGRHEGAFGRQPELGTGRIAWGLVAFGVVVTLVCTWWLFPSSYVQALTLQLLMGIILVSFVVVTGFGGQISLAQMALAGSGALVAAYLVSRHGWPLELAFLAGIAVTVPISSVLGFAGVRTRGVNLAILTLGFAIALEAVVLGNSKYTGGFFGYKVPDPTLFGIHISSIHHDERYAVLCLIALVLVSLVVANLRRGRSGRRLIAVRTNERAAAALGVSVVGAKVYAFVLGGVIAAIGGILIAFRLPSIGFDDFGAIRSVTVLQAAVLGGIGTLGGPLVGSTFTAGSITQEVFNFLGSDVAVAITTFSGVLVLLMLTASPSGLAIMIKRQNEWWLSRLRRRFRREPRLVVVTPQQRRVMVPSRLEVRDLTVHFGGVVAVSDLSFIVEPGEIVGLIGPNGAGKSTAIDAVMGFNRPARGLVMLGEHDVSSWSIERRARAGLSRSFQSLELFDDVTVRENILVACDPRDLSAYVTDLVKPGKGTFTDEAVLAINDFVLEPLLDTKVSDLPYAKRRALAVARAVSGGHSILMLDEPAAGLDEVETRELGLLIARMARERNVGILLVEHSVDMVLRTCDRIIVLDFGRMIACGTPAEIRSNQAVIDTYLGASRDSEPVESAASPAAR